MRLTYVGPLPPLRGGIAQHGAQLCAALRAAGNDVTAEGWRHQYPSRLYPGSQAPVGDPLPDARYRLDWWRPDVWWAVGREARRGDALVVPWVDPVQAPVHHVLMTGVGRRATVLVVHNALPHERRPLDVALARSVLRRATGALVHSRAVADEVAGLVPGLATIRVPHPPNLVLTPRPVPMGPPRLLFFGYVRPYKGLDLALEAVAILRRRGSDVRLTVAGEFWEPVERWRAQVDRLGLADLVELRPGYVDDAALGRLLAAHHGVLAPYRSATQSGIVPLAATAGRAVVATPVGGLGEVITDGRTGVLAAGVDAPAIADAVQRALGRWEQLADGARRAAPTWQVVADAVSALVDQAEQPPRAGRRGPPR